MYANSEDFQVLAITTMVSSFVAEYAYADTYADIAKRVGISEKNVSVRLTLIRQKMKQYLTEREVFV